MLLARLDERSLVGRAADGDLAAFEELFRRHSEAVYRLAVRLLSDRSDAEDAVQEVFVQAWKSLPGFRGESRFTTWLYRITVNRCRRVLRYRPVAAELSDLVADRRPGPAETTMWRAELAAAARALERLEPRQREVLVLRELAGCSYQQIAAICGLSHAAVRTRLHRARTDLVRMMEEPS